MERYHGMELVQVEESPQRGVMLDLASAANNLNALKIRHNLMVQATKEVLQDNVDFGKIPGTGQKPTLLKPGAEKLCFLFQLSPTFDLVDSIEDWDKGLFYYRYRCTLRTRDGLTIANAEGSCNSRETKYRYRNAKPKCPSCGAEAISRSKYPPRNNPNAKPGWWCRECKTDYAYDDPQVVGQDTGKVENSEPYELVNTIQKMAQKRAHVAATLIGTGASQFFTQDMEDLSIDVQVMVEPQTPKRKRSETPATPPQPEPASEVIDDIQDVVSGTSASYDAATWPKFQRSVLKLLPYYKHDNHIVNTLKNAGIEAPWNTWSAEKAAECWDYLDAYALENANDTEGDESAF